MTVGFAGKLRRWGCRIHPKVTSRPLEYARVPGILARLGLLNKVWLSPEGNTVDEMTWLTQALYGDGLRVFTLSLHSSSVEPGNTEYVQSEEDLKAMLNCLRRYFEYFIGELAGRPATPIEVTATFRAALSKKGTENR